MRGVIKRLDIQTTVSVILLATGTFVVSRFADPYTTSVAVGLLTWMYLCTSWNIIGGIVGQISFGHAAFFGIGAYVSTYLSTVHGISPWIGMWAGGLLSVVAALAIGYLPFRWNLSPLVFALLTLAFSYVLEFGISGIDALGGTNGLFTKPVGTSFWDFRFGNPSSFLIIIAVMLCALVIVVAALHAGKLGFFWRATHDNEGAASAMGVNTFRIKQGALALSAFFTALAGTFQAQFVGFIDPPSMFGIEVTIFILLFTVVGGAGSLVGPLLGPLILMPAGELLRVYFAESSSNGLHHMLYGIALMAVILLWPGGIVAALRRFGLTHGKLRVPPATTAEQPPASTASGGPEISLQVEHITKRFDGLVAVSDVSFEVTGREIFGVIGPNGAGKTTLFTMLSGFARPTSGKIVFDGHEIQKLSPSESCQLGIARTFQITQAFPSLTVMEVVYAAALVKETSDRARRTADSVVGFLGLTGRRDIKSSDLTLADQRRLEIARALATHPRIILVDEILAGLTPREADEAMKIIRGIRDAGVTVVVIEHMVRAMMALCDRILVLDAGEAISLGTPAEVANDRRVIEAYLGTAR